eukprot:scaffold2626_cov92-Isochrysis_galbana.AAC.2
MFRRILRRTLRPAVLRRVLWTLRCAGSCTLGGTGAKNRKGQNLELNIRLLLAKDRLSTLDHEGSNQTCTATENASYKGPQDPAPCTLRNILDKYTLFRSRQLWCRAVAGAGGDSSKRSRLSSWFFGLRFGLGVPSGGGGPGGTARVSRPPVLAERAGLASGHSIGRVGVRGKAGVGRKVRHVPCQGRGRSRRRAVARPVALQVHPRGILSAPPPPRGRPGLAPPVSAGSRGGRPGYTAGGGRCTAGGRVGGARWKGFGIDAHAIEQRSGEALGSVLWGRRGV